MQSQLATDADAASVIARLDLAPHPEGGFYRELYRSDRAVPSEHGERSALTAIYYLLTAETFSAWHRLRSDETWHFHHGSPLSIETLDAYAGHRRIDLGPDGPWVAVLPAGMAFAAHVSASDLPGGYALVSCCVAPGFDFADFELLDGAALATAFPEHAALARRFARDTQPDE
jgi:predicted cupin superfamily sugar epimerase